MRATFLAFQTASRAMASSQANLDVTGNNIANVNTNGYSRQRVDLNSISSGGFTQKYATFGATIGLGVDVSGISQIRDPFLDARYRNESAESGKYNTILSGLSDLENIFDEAETEGLQNEFSNFLNQLQTLSQSATSKEIALVVRIAAQKVTQIMNVYSKQVDEVRNQQIYDLSNVVVNNDFNTKVKNIASLNAQIRDEFLHGNNPNELLDKRNTLIDELSGIANIKVTTYPEKVSENTTIERLTISLYDAYTGTSIGLVDNDLFNTLSVNSTSENLKIEINSCFDPHETKDITDHFTGGSIKGYLDIINGKGNYANTATKENEFRGTLYYKEKMNTLAANFAYRFNYINGNNDANAKKLFTDSDGGTAITAANIRVSDEWLDDPSYITTTTATLSTGGVDNVLRMISAMSSDHSFVKDPYGTGTDIMFEGTFNEYMSGTIGEIALDVELNQNFAETAINVLSNLYTSREAISGVSLDEEGINLMAYQKSYNAAARYFTVLDEAVDTIINKMGVVGR